MNNTSEELEVSAPDAPTVDAGDDVVYTISVKNNGNGVADDKGIYYFVPKMIKYYLNEEPILKNAAAHPALVAQGGLEPSEAGKRLRLAYVSLTGRW